MKEQQKTLVLVGMMGAGKTTIGRLLAESLGLAFFDSDMEIERRAGKTISDIFDHDGERAFRTLEEKTLGTLLGGDACIIAAGGGAFLNAETRKQIQENAFSIWLDAPMEVMFERARQDNKRPLLQKENAGDVFATLYSERKEVYALADIHIVNGTQSSQKAVEDILAALKNMT